MNSEKSLFNCENVSANAIAWYLKFKDRNGHGLNQSPKGILVELSQVMNDGPLRLKYGHKFEMELTTLVEKSIQNLEDGDIVRLVDENSSVDEYFVYNAIHEQFTHCPDGKMVKFSITRCPHRCFFQEIIPKGDIVYLDMSRYLDRRENQLVKPYQTRIVIQHNVSDSIVSTRSDVIWCVHVRQSANEDNLIGLITFSGVAMSRDEFIERVKKIKYFKISNESLEMVPIE